MNRLVAASLTLLIACGEAPPNTGTDDDTGTDTDEEPLESGSETVSTSWDVDLFSMYEAPTIPAFDTLDGKRQLDGMTITVDHGALMTVNVENGGEMPLTADDYLFEYYLQTIVQLGATPEVEVPGEGPPFFGPGAFVASTAVDLDAYDGVSGEGTDEYEQTVLEEFLWEGEYARDVEGDEPYLDAMLGTEDITLVVGGFSETWIYWDDEFGEGGLLYAWASAVQYAGTITITYDYSPTAE